MSSLDWFGFAPIEQRRSRRKLWVGDISEWPEPSEYTKIRLILNNPQDKNVQALQAALRRPDIDTLSVNAACLKSQGVREHLTRLLAIGREWSVDYWWETPDGSDIFVESLALFDKVHFLQMDQFSEDMIPILESFHSLEELDISREPWSPWDLKWIYQHESMAWVIPHFVLQPINDYNFPNRFPQAAQEYLKSITLCQNEHSHQVLAEWIQQTSLLRNLRHFNILFDEGTTGVNFCDSMEALSAWIGSPACRLTHFLLDFGDIPCHHSLANSLQLIQAIGRNRSIFALCIDGLSEDMDWSTDVLPQISSSNVHHLDAVVDDPVQKLLLEWQCHMRPTRLLTIDIPIYPEISDMLVYVNKIHERWRAWQLKGHEDIPMYKPLDTSFLARLPPYLWAMELGKSQLPGESKGQRASLDVTLYLLRSWLTNIAVIPSIPPVGRKERKGKKRNRKES